MRCLLGWGTTRTAVRSNCRWQRFNNWPKAPRRRTGWLGEVHSVAVITIAPAFHWAETLASWATLSIS